MAKDVGHEKAVLQPFNKSGFKRHLNEVLLSTMLMLFIMKMVKNKQREDIFIVEEHISNLYENTGYLIKLK